MAYRTELLPEALLELRRFSLRFRGTIIRKVEHVAANLPQSLRLASIQPVKGQEELSIWARLYELDVGSGARVGLALYEREQLLLVYLVGTHDYAKANYLKAAAERLGSVE